MKKSKILISAVTMFSLCITPMSVYAQVDPNSNIENTISQTKSAENLPTPVLQEKEIEVLDALRAKQAAVFTEEADLTKLRDTLFIDGKANPAMIGQDPQVIAEAADVEIPEDSQIIAVKVDAVGSEELFCKEKMAPVLALKSYDDFE